MPTSEITIADLLKPQGYATGIVGKWHLGHHHQHLPLQRGFDEYFGIPYSNDMMSTVYIEGNEIVDFNPDQHYTTRTYTEKSTDFIERHADQPFFLYVAHSMPHVPLYASPKFQGTSDRGLYGDMIQELDWSVGEIPSTLEAQGLLENTLVAFSGDNGPWHVMREHGGSAGGLREGKIFTFDGSQRVPTVAMWPAIIKAGQTYTDLATMRDWMSTAADISGAPLPTDRAFDGESLLPFSVAPARARATNFFSTTPTTNSKGSAKETGKSNEPTPASKARIGTRASLLTLSFSSTSAMTRPSSITSPPNIRKKSAPCSRP